MGTLSGVCAGRRMHGFRRGYIPRSDRPVTGDGGHGSRVAGDRRGTSTAGNLLELEAIAAVVVGGTSITGGRGSTLAPLVGAVLTGVILNALTLLSVPPSYIDLFVGALILLAISGDALRRRLLGRSR